MKTTLQKMLCLLLVGCMALGLVACASSTAAEAATSQDQTTQVPSETASTLQAFAASESASALNRDEVLSQLKTAAAANAAGEIYYTFANFTTDDAMQILYESNTLSDVFMAHQSVSVSMTCRSTDGTLYTNELEASCTDGKTILIRAENKSRLGTVEVEGNSSKGMLVSQWTDGTRSVAVSAPAEFDGLFTETYMENEELVDFTNVRISQDNNILQISATMTYTGTQISSEVTYLLDSADLHLLALLWDSADSEGSYLTSAVFTYDKASTLSPVSLISDVTSAADAALLHVTYCAPELGTINTVDYKISTSVPVYIASACYSTVYTDSALTLESETDEIIRSGETSVYVLLTSYYLQEVLAYMDEAVPASPAPSPDLSVVVTKSPTGETVKPGDSCLFVARADNATSVTWYFISADGNTHVRDVDAHNYFGSVRVTGIGSGTLKLSEIPQSMDGWRVQAVFTGKNGPVYTNMATLTVQSAPRPTPSPVPTPEPLPTDREEAAKALAKKAVKDVTDRAGEFCFSCDTESKNFEYDASRQCAVFDLNLYRDDCRACFHFYVWVNGSNRYYVPVGYDSYFGGTLKDSVSFRSLMDDTACWADFNHAMYKLREQADGFINPVPAPSPEPTPEPTPEPSPEPTPEPQENLTEVAKSLANSCADDIAKRASGFTCTRVQNFSYDGSGDHATFDITLTRRDLTATFHFYAWVQGTNRHSVPVGYDSWYAGGDGQLNQKDSVRFESDEDEGICWNAFTSALSTLMQDADNYIRPAPAPEVTPEPEPENTPVPEEEPVNS